MGIKTKIVAAGIGAAIMMVIPIVEEVEDIHFKPYRDIAGVWTVCAGITGPDVILGKTYTKGECDALLLKHVKVAQAAVDGSVKREIPVSMRASLYSFTFNAGGGAFKKSTMLLLINQGKFKEACDQLWRWTKFKNPNTGKYEDSRGLKNRRAVEYKYCVKEL